MSIISKMRKQVAVYWEKTGTDQFGNPTYAVPVEIKCRWEDIHELFKNQVGDDVMSNSKVYVDRETREGGVLWLGALADLTSQTKPLENEGAYEIRRFEKLPNLKASEFLLTAML